MKNPGKAYMLADERIVIIRNEQPVKGKLMLELVNHTYEPLLDENNKQRYLIRDFQGAKDLLKSAVMCAFID